MTRPEGGVGATMANEMQLLRMLEPVVRPDGFGAPAGGRGANAAPIESRSFEDLLMDVRAGLETPSAQTDDPQVMATEHPPAMTDPLRGLGGVDQIENATLRNLVSQVAGRSRPDATRA